MRVSTDEQTFENQRPDVEHAIASRSFQLVASYEERVSAIARERPEYERMMQDARRGRFDVLVVWALDRFGRSFAGNVQAVAELDARGIRVVSVREDWLDTTSALARQILLGVVSAIAEDERRRISERTRAGMQRARAQGVRIGRPPADVDELRARELVGEGHSLREVSRRLKIPESTLRSLLRRKGLPGGDA